MNKERVIIIGSGPAGLTASIYLARSNLSPLLFEGFSSGGMPGGQLMSTSTVENYPGFPDGVAGPELMMQMRQQAQNNQVRMIMADITEIDLSSRPFTLTDSNGDQHTTDSLIVATGATAKRLPLESEQLFWNKGISACAVCDGALPIFRNKPLAIIGGGDTAVEDAEHLTQFASKVYLIHRRDELRASNILQERIKKNAKIEILWNTVPVEFYGDKTLQGIRLKNTVTGDLSEITVSGCFEAIGHTPNTRFLGDQIKKNDTGYLVINPGTNITSVEGVFAAGDVQDPFYRQAIVAAGSGAQAALTCEHWLRAQP